MVYFDLYRVVLRSRGFKEASLNTFGQPTLMVMGWTSLKSRRAGYFRGAKDIVSGSKDIVTGGESVAIHLPDRSESTSDQVTGVD